MSIRDMGVEIGVDIDESPFADLNREMDEIADMMRSFDISALDELEREARGLVGDFGLMDDAVSEFDRSLADIDDGSIEQVSADTGIATKAMEGLKLGVMAVIATIGTLAASFGMFAMDAEAAFGRLSVQTGATGEELEVLKDAAYDTFSRGYGESLQEVTDAMARVRQNIHGLDDEELSNVTANAMLLADAFDSEINEVTRGAQGLMNAFGIDSEKAFDLFAYGAQNGLNVSDDLFDQMSEFAPVAAHAGYSVEELFFLLQRGAANGAYNMDRVNNAILEFGDLSTDGSDATKDAFGQLSESTQDLWQDMLAGKATSKELSETVINELKSMDDQTLANQIGATLWGSVWTDNTQEVMYAMLDTTGAIQGFDGAMAASADAVEGTFKNRMLGAWRELQTGILQVVDNPASKEFFDAIATKAEELVPYLVAGAEGLFEFGASVVDGTSAVNEFVETYAPFIAGLAGGAGVYFIITGAIALYTGAAGLATTATTAFGTAMAFLTSPIGIAVAVIAAAIAIGVALWQNWDVVMAKLDVFKAWIAERFTSIKASISNAIQPAIGLFDSLMAKWDAFKEKVSNFSIKGAVSGAVDWVSSKIPGFDTGIGRVPHDMVAEIHKDEAIIPASDAQMLRDIGVIDSDGRYPSINMDNLRDTGGTYQTTQNTSNSSVSVQAPITIVVQGGSTNEETARSLKAELDAYFADLLLVMEG